MICTLCITLYFFHTDIEVNSSLKTEVVHTDEVTDNTCSNGENTFNEGIVLVFVAFISMLSKLECLFVQLVKVWMLIHSCILVIQWTS